MATDYVGRQFRVNDKVFVVENLVAEGGFALVFKARDVGSGRVVALKRIMVNNQHDLKLAKQEVAVMRALSNNRNSVTVYDWSIVKVDDDIHEILIVMELYTGGTVLEMMNRRLKNGFKEKEVLAIFSDVLLTVTRLHHRTKQIIHRDLKVENIIHSSEGHFVLCDYGSCHIMDMDPKQLGVAECEEQIKRFTTLAYRSPEMVDLYSGHKITTKSDIWALGCLLYKLCFFTTPFGEQPLAILSGQFTIPDDSKYSNELHKLIRYMLETDPKKRPDIYQVSHLVFLLRGEKNPVINIFKSRVPNFLDIPLPMSESEAKQVAVPSKKKLLAPTVIQTTVSARQRPRSGHSPNPPRRAVSGPQQSVAPQQPTSSLSAANQQVNTDGTVPKPTPASSTGGGQTLESVNFQQTMPSSNISEEDFDPRGELTAVSKPPPTHLSADVEGFTDSFAHVTSQQDGCPKSNDVSYDAFGSPVFTVTSEQVKSVPQIQMSSHDQSAGPRPPSSHDQPVRPHPPSISSDDSPDQLEDHFGLTPFLPSGSSPTKLNKGFRDISTEGFGEDTFGAPSLQDSTGPQTTTQPDQEGDQFGTTPFVLDTASKRTVPSNSGVQEDLFGTAPFTAHQETTHASVQARSPWQQDTDSFGAIPFANVTRNKLAI